LTTCSDNRLRLWDLSSGKEISPPGQKEGAFLDLSATTLLVWSAAFSADGTRLLTVGGAEAHLWHAHDAKQLMTFSPQSAVSSVQFSKGGEQIVTGSWDNAARIWNTATGADLIKLGGVHTRFVNASVFSPDGTQVLTASDDKTARLWNAATGKLVRSFVGHEGRVTDVALSSDGKWVLTASDDSIMTVASVSVAEPNREDVARVTADLVDVPLGERRGEDEDPALGAGKAEVARPATDPDHALSEFRTRRLRERRRLARACRRAPRTPRRPERWFPGCGSSCRAIRRGRKASRRGPG
jgi:hypothetical protein